MDILGKITKLREERDWSLYKLAEEAGITQSTLANMFYRKTMPSINTLKQICDAFGITLSEFFNCSNSNDDKEFELLSQFRELNDSNKKLIIEIAKTIKKQQ